MKKVLLLGANGMLGQSFKKYLKQNYEVITVARENATYCMDITEDEKLNQCFKEVKPDIVINVAACVNLAQCEEDKELAYLVNARMPGVVANLCEEYNAYFIQVSTDHFFQNDERRKHTETDRIVLLNEYARSKYIGECLSLLYNRTLVLRTNIVGFRNSDRKTFVEWVLDGIEKNEEFSLYTDFYTSSMFTDDFVKVCMDLIEKETVGILNVASSDVSSKKEFVLKLAQKLRKSIRYKDATIHTSGGVNRADALGLSTERVEELVGYNMPSLEETIQHIVEGLDS